MKHTTLRLMSLVTLLTYTMSITASLNNAASMPNEQDMANLMAMLEKITKEEGKQGALETPPLTLDEAATMPAIPQHELDALFNGLNEQEQRLSSEGAITQKTNDYLDKAEDRLGEEGQQKIELLKEPFINLLKSSALTHLTDVMARQEAAQIALTSFINYITQKNGEHQGPQQDLMHEEHRHEAPEASLIKKSQEKPSSLVPTTPIPAPSAALSQVSPQSESIQTPLSTPQAMTQPATAETSPTPAGPLPMPAELAHIEAPIEAPIAPELNLQTTETMPLSTTPNVNVPPLSAPTSSSPTMPSPTQNQPLFAMSPGADVPTVPNIPEMPAVPEMPSVQIPSDAILIQPEAPLPTHGQQASVETSQDTLQPLQGQPLEGQQSYQQEQSIPTMPSQEIQPLSFEPEQQEQPPQEEPLALPTQALEQPQAETNVSESTEMPPFPEAEQPQELSETSPE